MADQQYDVSPKMKKLFEEKQKQRAAAKKYYMDLIYNPHRPINQGVPMDTGLLRYSAMSYYHVEYFRPTPSFYGKYLLYISPFFLLFFHIRHVKAKKEELLRSGAVSYADREYKYLY